jgi:ABC-type transport system involved in cytochrome c biogenesis permease subunit
LTYFLRGEAQIGPKVRLWFVVSVILHSLYLVLLGVHLDHLPVGNLFQVLTSFAWLLVVVYLYLELRLKEMTMGVFLLPIVLLFHIVSTLLLNLDQPLATVLSDMLFEVHVAFIISAYAAFTISFITSTMYLLLSHEMHSKELGIFFQRLPSLEFFESISNQSINIGFVLIAIGFILGLEMGLELWEGQWYTEPKLLSVIAALVIYLIHIVTRRSMGWRGKRAAIISIIGFTWLFTSMTIVNLFFTRFHKFQ